MSWKNRPRAMLKDRDGKVYQTSSSMQTRQVQEGSWKVKARCLDTLTRVPRVTLYSAFLEYTLWSRDGCSIHIHTSITPPFQEN